MNKEALITVQEVSKKFCTSLNRSLAYGLADMGKRMLGINSNGKLRREEFWAVQNINFTLRRGECLGLIGHNGAGKSTLLKMLNGLILPDHGRIEMRGRVGALIELGSGFNPVLTGRENVYNNGAVLGFTKDQIDKKFDEIVAFAELEEFIDMPVQNYSSGMKVRLGFSIAAQMEPDILLIDEVLAVGDMGFVLKCFNVIDTLLPNTAVIFVSHNMNQVSRICTDILMMEKGSTAFHGFDVSRGIDQYYSRFAVKKKISNKVKFNRSDDAELIAIRFDGEEDGKIFGLNWMDDLVLNIHLKVNEQFVNPSLKLNFFDREERSIGVCLNEGGLSEANIVGKESGQNHFKVKLKMPRINLSKGVYSVTLSISEGFRFKPILRIDKAKQFQVFSTHDIIQPIQFEAKWG